MVDVVAEEPLFGEAMRFHFAESGMKSPLIATSYFGERLPHDPHPSRDGHRILSLHYIHTMAALGWLPVAASDLPPLRGGLELQAPPRQDPSRLSSLQAEAIRRYLPGEIAFERLNEDAVVGFLGGIYPSTWDSENRLREFPYGAPKSVFSCSGGPRMQARSP